MWTLGPLTWASNGFQSPSHPSHPIWPDILTVSSSVTFKPAFMDFSRTNWRCSKCRSDPKSCSLSSCAMEVLGIGKQFFLFPSVNIECLVSQFRQNNLQIFASAKLDKDDCSSMLSPMHGNPICSWCSNLGNLTQWLCDARNWPEKRPKILHGFVRQAQNLACWRHRPICAAESQLGPTHHPSGTSWLQN